MTYADDYDEYEDYDEDDAYEEAAPAVYRGRSRAVATQPEGQLTRQAIDWGVGGSILAVLVLTALYIFSPLDLVPDVIPVAGQADDLAAVLAGGGSVVFLTAARYILQAALASRVGRIGCALVILFASIGAIVVFWALLQAFSALF